MLFYLRVLKCMETVGKALKHTNDKGMFSLHILVIHLLVQTFTFSKYFSIPVYFTHFNFFFFFWLRIALEMESAAQQHEITIWWTLDLHHHWLGHGITKNTHELSHIWQCIIKNFICRSPSVCYFVT